MGDGVEDLVSLFNAACDKIAEVIRSSEITEGRTIADVDQLIWHVKSSRALIKEAVSESFENLLKDLEDARHRPVQRQSGEESAEPGAANFSYTHPPAYETGEEGGTEEAAVTEEEANALLGHVPPPPEVEDTAAGDAAEGVLDSLPSLLTRLAADEGRYSPAEDYDAGELNTTESPERGVLKRARRLDDDESDFDWKRRR
eukprot:Hpha_TRINITY_DN5969_c0_g1::TRINITY_DN5969_c0_g1_i1::g.147219::m.147219